MNDVFILKERRRALLLTLAVCLTLISACSSSSDPAGPADAGTASVASLATPTTEEATVTPATAERPLIRSDTSEAERIRLFKVYVNCMKDNGLPAAEAKNFLAKRGVASETATKYRKQCGAKEPLPIYEKARTSDPDFADHLRAEAKCLNEHGVPVEITKDGQIAGEGLPPEDKAHWLDDCEQQAFADYYDTLQ